MRKEPRKAFEFFHAIIPMMADSPYLWLRLAECCVMFYKDRVTYLRKEKQISPVIARKYQTATRTFIVLPQTDYKLFEEYPLPGDRCMADLNLDFAGKCTRNAISLCTKEEFGSLKINAQLLSAYIALELGDGRRAAEMGRLVSLVSTVDPPREYLAKIYTAQGNLMMGEVSQSSRILSRLPIESKLLLESNREKRDRLLETIRLLTFARASIATPDIKKAQNQLAKITDTEASRPEVVLTKVAMQLKMGDYEQAIAQLKSFQPDA
jgi:CCR4-NOT transcription complex subunit 10